MGFTFPTAAPEAASGMSTAQLAVVLIFAVGVPPIVLFLTRWRVGSWLANRARGLALANVVAQVLIIVTGGAVRLTGSGLGCSSWPECEPGAYVPTAVEESNLHPYIEFGNRLLTFVLLAVAVLLAIALWHGRRELRWLGLVPYAGIMVQAVVGGIAVLRELTPLVVALHLWISVALVWFSTWLWLRVRGTGGSGSGRRLAALRWLSVPSFTLVILLGTLTTGAGPHSGDAEATERLALDPALIARAHALSVWAFVGLVGLMVILVWRGAAGPGSKRAVALLVAATLAQGAIGYAQYFLGLPELLVGIHLLGVGLLAAAHSAAFRLTRRA